MKYSSWLLIFTSIVLLLIGLASLHAAAFETGGGLVVVAEFAFLGAVYLEKENDSEYLALINTGEGVLYLLATPFLYTSLSASIEPLPIPIASIILGFGIFKLLVSSLFELWGGVISFIFGNLIMAWSVVQIDPTTLGPYIREVVFILATAVAIFSGYALYEIHDVTETWLAIIAAAWGFVFLAIALLLIFMRNDLQGGFVLLGKMIGAFVFAGLIESRSGFKFYA